MSGITGIYNSKISPNSKQDIQTTLDAMTHALSHRGPNSKGIWFDPVLGVGLGHQRLGLYDLSPTGHEPMLSSCGRYLIVCDGEVYARNEIIKELAHCQRYLKSKSSTEIILESCAQWGIEIALKRLNGAYAFALYDKDEHMLFLARDKIGVKPLYYGYFNGLLIFGSELKALRANHDWEPRLNRDALAGFMRHRYIPTPESIYQHVYKLQHGSVLKINLQGQYKITSFWDPQKIVASKAKFNQNLSDQELLKKLDELFNDAIKQRMSVNVPIGAFLSGGVDSALIAALMTKHSAQPINTFSIGFHEAEYNEAPSAKKIASHLGTHHTELYVDAKDALALVNEIPKWYDEPFADQSQIPTMMLCALAKHHVGAVMSGDGADVLMGGLNHYYTTINKWKEINKLPYPIRQMIQTIIHATPTAAFNCLGSKGIRIEAKLRNFAHKLQIKKPEDIFRSQLSSWDGKENIIKNAHELKEGVWWNDLLDKLIPSILDRMILMHIPTILPDRGIAKIDRASMSVALDVSVPFLDDRVVEYALQSPCDFKYRNQQTKWGVREILHPYVPSHLIHPGKMGFSVPIHRWLRGPLKDWAEILLNEERLKSQNLFEYPIIRERWQAFLKNEKKSGDNFIWSVLMAQVWIDANKDVLL